MWTKDFEYELEPERIAQVPVEPRDSSRLLDARDLSDHHFSDLPGLLNPGDLVVVNRSRVRAARLVGVKSPTGGRVEALLLGPITDDRWRAMVRPARRIRVGTVLDFGPITAIVDEAPREGVAILHLKAEGDLEEAISLVGTVPLPPYITADLANPERYQTIFAREVGSAAAPTAGLHFTADVVAELARRKIGTVSLELRVGLDTFRPIGTNRVEDHQIHTEEFSIPEATRHAIEECSGRVVAVGTTVVRALESNPEQTTTDLFITPGFEFKTVDLLVTNFHLPRTSLLVLLAAFMGPRWRTAYEVAIERDYRFASFGDAMLAERL
ncbi:MAG TPA: tRNA preQ1(34) S-adenosylmethionine ribosyltransferase-isomerase QueA [Acidimicrobiia bacterium]|nr:tRNA preQ1(34) S-adenosylmethionine ribosyltransferase-isomerase QueA [Acidimicrobiia bacterium]